MSGRAHNVLQTKKSEHLLPAIGTYVYDEVLRKLKGGAWIRGASGGKSYYTIPIRPDSLRWYEADLERLRLDLSTMKRNLRPSDRSPRGQPSSF